MPDDVKAGEMPGGEKPGPGEMSGNGGPTPGDPAVELEQLRAELKRANKESADRRKKLEGYELKEKASAEAELTELQKARQRLTELETRDAAREAERQELTARYEFTLAVLRPGSGMDPAVADAAWKLLNRSELEFGEDGRPTNIPTVMKNLIKAYPFLAAKSGEKVPDINAEQAGKAKANETDQERLKELRARYRF